MKRGAFVSDGGRRDHDVTGSDVAAQRSAPSARHHPACTHHDGLLKKGCGQRRTDPWVEHRHVDAVAVDPPDRMQAMGSFEFPHLLGLRGQSGEDLGVEAENGSLRDGVTRSSQRGPLIKNANRV